MAEDVDINSSGSNYKVKIVKKLMSKNLNKATEYLTSKIRLAFTQLKKVFIKALIF